MEFSDRLILGQIEVEVKHQRLVASMPLYEEHGHVDFSNVYCDIVKTYVKKYVLPKFLHAYNIVQEFPIDIDVYKEKPELLKCREELKKEILKEPWKSQFNNKSPFFRNIHIDLSLRYSDDFDYIAYYDTEKTRYAGFMDGTVAFVINIDSKSDIDILNAIDYNLEHEFIHAFEDYSRRNWFKTNLPEKLKRDNYDNYLKTKHLNSSGRYVDNSDFENDISNLLYFTYDSEVNAERGEIFSDLKRNVGVIKNSASVNDILELIKQSHVYEKLQRCIDTWNKLYATTNPTAQKNCLDFVNDKTKKSFKTYKEMVEWLYKKTLHFKQQLDRQAVKDACDIYSDNYKFSRAEKMIHVEPRKRNVSKLSDHFSNRTKNSNFKHKNKLIH